MAGQGPGSGWQFSGGYNPSNGYNPLNRGPPQYNGGLGYCPPAGGQPLVYGRQGLDTHQFDYGRGGGASNTIAGGAPWPGTGSSNSGAHPAPRGGAARQEWMGGYLPTMQPPGQIG